jgi:DNA polymerase I
MPVLYLIDGHAYLHRAYHALPPLTNSHGQPVNAVYGFVRMLMKIIRQEKPDYIAVCFDTPAPTFRHEAYTDYKATRKETDDALKSQMPLAREAVNALNLASYELDGYEADDVIAHLTRQGTREGWNVVIVSADKDTLQLVNDHVKVLSEPKNIFYDASKVQERYGLPPERLPDYFALVGDASDNVKGVPGIGPKTAVKLIQEYGEIEALLKAAPSIKGKTGALLQANAESARQSLALVRLDRDVPFKSDWNDMSLRPPQAEQLSPFLQRMEFHAMLDEILPPEASPAAHLSEDYLALLTEDALKAWLREAQGESAIAIDVLASENDPLRAALLGIAVSFKAGSARYIPLHTPGLGGPRTLSLETVRKHLQPLLEGTSPAVYGHNLKFIQLLLKRHGLSLGKMRCDAMVASYVLNPSRSGHGLKELVLEMSGERMAGIEQLLGKGAQQLRPDQLPLEKAAPFICANADRALRVSLHLEKQIKEKKLDSLFYEMEMPLIDVLAEMEEVGVRIDRPYLDDLGKTMLQRIQALEKKIYDLAGEPFNINSPKQLSSVLFEKLKLPVIRRTKTGFSTDEEVLQTLSASHALPASLIEFRELQKLRSTYIEGLQSGLLLDESRVHTNFNQTVASTGRLSSSSPNLQNIPIRTDLGRQIRKAFVPEPGCVFLSADYSQIDLRVLAHISGDKTLTQAFQKSEDVHLYTACEVFGVRPQDATAEMRRAAKSINFGIVYGMSAYGLSQQLQIPPEQAKAYIDKYFERYPGVKAWIEQILEEARKNGYVKTLLGRVRYLPEILSRNSAVRGFAERTAMNTPIQGTSADIIKLAMLQLRIAHQKKEWAGRMLLQVHDELLFEITPPDLPPAQKKIKQMMEQALPLSVPVVVDLKTGPNWAELKAI